MAGFTLRKGTAEIEEWTISAGTAYYAGDLFEIDVGSAACTVATSATICWVRKGVLTHDISTADAKLRVQVVNADQEWEVESSTTSAATSDNDAFILSDENTVNNSSHSTAKEAVVTQIRIVGATTEQRILVKFTSTSSGLTHDAS